MKNKIIFASIAAATVTCFGAGDALSATKTKIGEFTTPNSTTWGAALAEKADASSVYTKTETDTKLASKAAASDLTTLSNTVNDSTTGLAATRTLATNLSNTVNDATTGLASKASASALTALSNTVNDSTTGLAATKAIADQAATNASSATDTANAVKGVFNTDSSTGAITTLKTDAVPSLAISKITDLQSTLNSKASASNVYTKTEADNKYATTTDMAKKLDADDISFETSNGNVIMKSGTKTLAVSGLENLRGPRGLQGDMVCDDITIEEAPAAQQPSDGLTVKYYAYCIKN